MANPETKDLVIPLCLWQKKIMIAVGLRGRTVKKCIDPDTIANTLKADLIRQIQDMKRHQGIETPA